MDEGEYWKEVADMYRERAEEAEVNTARLERFTLQDEARATWGLNNWSERSYQLRAVARDDFRRWEQEIEDWWVNGCPS